MARKTSQIIRRGPAPGWSPSTSVAIPRPENASTSANPLRAGYAPRRPISTTCLRSATFGRNIRSSRQTLGQYLDHWLEISAQPRLRAKSLRDYTGLLARYLRASVSDLAIMRSFLSRDIKARPHTESRGLE